MKELKNRSEDLFRKLQFQFLKNLIQIAITEGDEIENKIQEIELSQKYKCKNKACQKVYKIVKFKCSECAGRVERITIPNTFEPYGVDTTCDVLSFRNNCCGNKPEIDDGAGIL